MPDGTARAVKPATSRRPKQRSGAKPATGRPPKQHFPEKRPTEQRPLELRPAAAHPKIADPKIAHPKKEHYVGGLIVVSDYDAAWPGMFKAESTRLRAALGSLAQRIEHMGSTAVPGLPSKPVIDFLIGVTSLAEARARSIKPLEAMGYRYIPEYEAFLPGELFFRKLGDKARHVPAYHLHVMEPSNPPWERFLAFRDYLRAHPRAARAYADLKRSLAAQCRDDIAAYRTSKHDFVEKTTEKALAERRRGGGRNTS
jgi:GrpB-like predicted nucleotidyltransferase (UPF0157 family)